MMAGQARPFEALAAYERHALLIRWLAMLAGAGWCLTLLFAGLAGWLAATKRVEPVFVEFSTGGNNFVNLRHAGGNLSWRSEVVRAALRHYVVAREKVDHVTEPLRYPVVYAMSNANVRAEFKRFYGGEEAAEKRKRYRREVVVLRDNALAKGIHQVAFRTLDYVRRGTGYTSLVNDWVVTMRYVFSAQNTALDDTVKNPLGIFVSHYDLRKSRTPKLPIQPKQGDKHAKKGS